MSDVPQQTPDLHEIFGIDGEDGAQKEPVISIERSVEADVDALDGLGAEPHVGIENGEPHVEIESAEPHVEIETAAPARPFERDVSDTAEAAPSQELAADPEQFT